MKEKLTCIVSDAIIKRMVYFFAGILVLFCSVIAWKWNTMPPELPLFYSLPRGTEQLATPTQFLIAPAFAVIFFCINFIVALFLYEKRKFAATLFVLTGTVISLLLFITFARILFQVT
jgi:hypothetical protein